MAFVVMLLLVLPVEALADRPDERGERLFALKIARLHLGKRGFGEACAAAGRAPANPFRSTVATMPMRA